ncbi:hypothetical protein [Pectobacterium carotovorum]|nr:hypothetical protein [Pectobacterium carotovorum]
MQEWKVYKKALTESPTYKAEMQKYGTGRLGLPAVRRRIWRNW